MIPYAKSKFMVRLTSDNHPLICNKEVDDMDFLEDDGRYLQHFFNSIDSYIRDNPNAVEEFDSELFALVDELVDGVEV